MIKINNLIKVVNEDEIYRVLWLDKKIDLAYIININEKYMPKEISLSAIEEDILIDKIQIIENDIWINIFNADEITILHKEHMNKAWSVIEKLVYEEPWIYQDINRRKLIVKVAEIENVSESTVKRYLKRYWVRGKIKTALLPYFNNCGAAGKERESNGIKRGRPRSNAQILGLGINIDSNMKKIFSAAINKYYNTSTKNTITTCYELMIKDYFSEFINKSILDINECVPTLAQFKYWFYKKRDYKKEISSRYGDKRYEQRHRPVLGKTESDKVYPGNTYQIDATIFDVYLVSEYGDRNEIIGRPVVYMVMDSFSRMITGFYIGLEGPSYIGAVMALVSVATNKVSLCKRYGVEIREDEWNIDNMPDFIIADRGELEGYKIEELISNLGIGIKLTPPFRADWKGIVEQNFRSMNLLTKPFLPGKIDTDFRERGDRDYRLDAKLTINEFTKIIIKAILYHNNHHVLENYDRSKYQIDDDVKPIPRELWEWGIQNMSGRLKVIPEEIVKLNLLPICDGVITSKGLKVKGMYYTSKKMMEDNYFEIVRNTGIKKIKVTYDPRNINHIYIKHDDGRGFDKCFLLEHQERYKNKNLEDIEYLLSKEKLNNKILKEEALQAKITLMNDIEDIVIEAKNGSRYKNQSKNKRLKGIDENRKIEKELNRTNEAIELSENNEVVREETIEFNKSIISELELLKLKQKRRLSGINEQ